jgi:cytochrome c-type protein NapB
MEVAKMKQPVTKFLTALTAAGAALFAALATADVQSLRGADVAAVDQAPDEKAQVGGRPGSQKPIDRSFQQQPPLIPHMTANFDEITLEENQCLSCHDVKTYKEKKAPKIGDSHFLDRTGKKLKTVSNARWNCLQCHVPQVDAPPLVDNTFQTVPAAAKGKK